MHAFTRHFVFEFRAIVRHKQLLLMNYLFPLGFYLLMGFILVGVNPLFREDIIPAMMIFSILAATLMGIPIALSSAREHGILRSYKINGVPAASIIAIGASTTALHLLIVAACITVSAPLLFDAILPGNAFLFALVFCTATLNCAGISVLIGVISANTRAAILWAQLIFVTSILLGGLMFPNAMLPESAQQASKLLPATHAMNAFNGLAMDKATEFSAWGSLIVLLTGGVLAFLLALTLFRWDPHQTQRRGGALLGLLAFLPFVASVFLLT